VQIPDSTLGKLKSAARRPWALRGWQLSLRTLFVMVTVCGLIAWFHDPLLAWARSVWEMWFPRYDPSKCGPCGMG
jgi:hypothetical protein